MAEIIHTIPRDLLEKYFSNDPRLISLFEEQSAIVETVRNETTGAVESTQSLQNATVVTLSTNAVFNNEFVLTNGDGTALVVGEGTVSIRVDETVVRSEGGSVIFIATGQSTLELPASGKLVSDTGTVTLFNKTLDKPTMTSPVIIHGLIDCDTDIDAAAAGVPIDGLYRDGNVVCVRRS